MIRSVVFDVGETLTSDRRFWADWADWLQVPHHTLSALVGAVVAQGRDNADVLRLIRPGLDLPAEYEARESDIAGVSAIMVGSIEQGVRVPSDAVLDALAGALDVDPARRDCGDRRLRHAR